MFTRTQRSPSHVVYSSPEASLNVFYDGGAVPVSHVLSLFSPHAITPRREALTQASTLHQLSQLLVSLYHGDISPRAAFLRRHRRTSSPEDRALRDALLWRQAYRPTLRKRLVCSERRPPLTHVIHGPQGALP